MAKGVATATGIEQAQTLVNARNSARPGNTVFAGQSEDGTLGYTWGYIGDDAVWRSLRPLT